MADNCPVCQGTKRPVGVKGSCLCGGTGLLADAFTKLQELFMKERNEHEETKDSLRAMQKAVLGFIFDPQFRKLDHNGYFRRYWEDKLQLKMSIAVNDSGEVEATRKL